MHSPQTSGLQRLQWLAGGFLLTFSSAFGQTFFIALFASDLKGEFGLSDGAFGTFYMAATLASATVLMWVGRVADRRDLKRVSVLTLAGLALTAAAMASVTAAWMLFPVLFGLRLFGQGLPGHISLTAMARWFVARRGRAIAIAAMGFPASQAVLPIIAIALTGAYGWRMTWWLSAAAVALLSIPLILLLFRNEPHEPERSAMHGADPRVVPARRQWTRAEVLRDPIFYVLMPGVLTSPFVVTGIFFHQITIVHAKGWDLTWFVGWYAANAATTVIATLATGWAIDRFGAARVLPGFLLPLVAGVAVLTASDNPYAAPAFMVLSGLSLGSANTVLGAIWAELYGTRHLGSIRALASSGGVLASALAPGLMGYLFDAGVTVTHQLAMLAAYTLVSACLLVMVAPRLRLRSR
ncbi:MFS transporter [Microvirga makkahensis]|uniref:MFS transporter n=1 Tax=Microvirga makkahensis TaxID=1128670 RepID=A0A7X3MVQ0_9HYPH|nr:MFS transporter [Microvirga makkahensis]MXQ14097.1 MFS transporter [Microvirga makkahensis]